MAVRRPLSGCFLALLGVAACDHSAPESATPSSQRETSPEEVSNARAALPGPAFSEKDAGGGSRFRMVGVVSVPSADAPDDPRLKVFGRLPYVVVQRLVSPHERRFWDCHASGATVKFAIGLSGKPEDVHVDGAADAPARACLVEVTSHLVFPEPPSIVRVEYTPSVEHTP